MGAPAVAFEPFTEDHQAFRRTVRAFVEQELAPHGREWDEAGSFPRALFRRFGELGLFGIRQPPEVGGSGLDWWYVVAYAEELARCRNAGLAVSMLVHGEMAIPVIGELGTEAQRREFLAPAVRGERVAALAISEPDAGSDVAAIRTTARRDGADLVVNGSKMWITNGARADFLTLAVRTGEAGHGGLSLLLFPTDVKGFQVSRTLEKVGLPSSDTAVLFFEECRVPAANLLGEQDQGFYHVMANFQGERLVAAVQAVAGMQLMLEDAMRYGGERSAFGRPVAKFQAWRHRLADHLTAVEAARWLTYRAADLLARGEPAVREISMAKLFACELAQRVAYDCMQLHGGMGYVLESDIARAWRDVRAMTIAGGTSEIMRELVSRAAGL
ncbi:acyl-CoA dehydrogenase domain protein [Anaeromyxobacter sp. K]|uniref:acyl-CoA dehydrogenase family protein n=1 Tax=Anaeromyxobacter sp. (strain K) TaxID=447217 RepID=UPI00015FA000|nr:acyl-CoA dehydrogenase family protein [Anaeromyxobacter sp. K]ACG72425.1 acyl-CoA dehydrogenase domain protein [Anaeromyxobacter sp. K]